MKNKTKFWHVGKYNLNDTFESLGTENVLKEAFHVFKKLSSRKIFALPMWFFREIKWRNITFVQPRRRLSLPHSSETLVWPRFWALILHKLELHWLCYKVWLSRDLLNYSYSHQALITMACEIWYTLVAFLLFNDCTYKLKTDKNSLGKLMTSIMKSQYCS